VTRSALADAQRPETAAVREPSPPRAAAVLSRARRFSEEEDFKNTANFLVYPTWPRMRRSALLAARSPSPPWLRPESPDHGEVPDLRLAGHPTFTRNVGPRALQETRERCPSSSLQHLRLAWVAAAGTPGGAPVARGRSHAAGGRGRRVADVRSRRRTRPRGARSEPQVAESERGGRRAGPRAGSCSDRDRLIVLAPPPESPRTAVPLRVNVRIALQGCTARAGSQERPASPGVPDRCARAPGAGGPDARVHAR